MRPKRPTKPLQLERRTLRDLATTDLTSVAAGIGTGDGGGGGCDSKWWCPTFPYC